MRRILRKIAEDDFGNLGDTSTLADPSVVDDLVNNRQNRKGGETTPAGKSEAAPPAARTAKAETRPAAKHPASGLFRRLFGG